MDGSCHLADLANCVMKAPQETKNKDVQQLKNLRGSTLALKLYRHVFMLPLGVYCTMKDPWRIGC